MFVSEKFIRLLFEKYDYILYPDGVTLICRIIQSTEIETLCLFNIPEVLDGNRQSIPQGRNREF